MGFLVVVIYLMYKSQSARFWVSFRIISHIAVSVGRKISGVSYVAFLNRYPLIFLYGMRLGSNLTFLYVDIQFSHNLLKGYSYPDVYS